MAVTISNKASLEFNDELTHKIAEVIYINCSNRKYPSWDHCGDKSHWLKTARDVIRNIKPFLKEERHD